MRETTFEVKLDIPTTPRAKYYFRAYLIQLAEQLDMFGCDGQPVGIGFVWETHTGLKGVGLNTLSRRMQRALRTSGILSARAEPYHMIQKINYVRDGEPGVVFRLREGWKENE